MLQERFENITAPQKREIRYWLKLEKKHTSCLKKLNNKASGLTGGNSPHAGVHDQKAKIEAALTLGDTPKMASRDIGNQAFDAAMLPTINSMVTMGIVFLPGMMTGQILSGTSPLVVVEYQIAIMLGIVGSVFLSVILFVQLGYRTYFNHRSQLNL